MTQREFFESVITLCGKSGVAPNAEMVAIATKHVQSLDTKNAKAKEKRLANAVANEPIEQGIVEYLTTHKVALANELAVACGVSTPKVVAVAGKMNTVKVSKIKVPKVGERNAYSLIKSEQCKGYVIRTPIFLPHY